MLLACWCCRHNRAVADGPHCRMQPSERALFGKPAFFFRSNVVSDRRHCSACRESRPKVMLSRLEKDVYQYFWQQEFFQHFGRWAQLTNWSPVFADVVVIAGS